MRRMQRQQVLPSNVMSSQPPWLWCWLLLYLTGYFHSYAYIFVDVSILIDARNDLFSDPEKIVEASLTLGELIPLLALLVGVLLVFLPWLRGHWLRLKYNIRPVDDMEHILPQVMPLLREIEAFILSSASEVQVSYAIGFPDHHQTARGGFVDFLRTGWREITDRVVTPLPYPITYWTNYFQTTITISHSLLYTWQTNRQKAQEVLLHELAHHYQGDAAIVGAGSLLEVVSRSWLWFAVIFTVLPLILFNAIYYIQYMQGFALVEKILPGAQQALIKHVLQDIWVYDIPALLLSLTLSLLWNAANFSMLIVAIWSAELGADRFVLDKVQSMSMLADARSASVWQWIFRGTHHPPLVLRRWAIRQQAKIGRSMLLLLFPLSFFLYLLLLCVQNTVYALPILYSGTSIVDLFALIANGAMSYLFSAAPIFICALVLLLLWRWCGSAWQRLFHPATRVAKHSRYKMYMVGIGLIVGCVMVEVLLARQPVPVIASAVTPSTILPVETPTATVPTDDLPIPQLRQRYQGILENAANHKETLLTLAAIVQDQQGHVRSSVTMNIPHSSPGACSGTIANDRLFQLTCTFVQKNVGMNILLTGTLQKDGSLKGVYTMTDIGQVGQWQAKPA